MAKIDIPLKRVLALKPADWLKFLLPDCTVKGFSVYNPEKTPRIQSKLDGIFEVKLADENIIVHIENQGYKEETFPVRMMRYRADIWEATMRENKGRPKIRQIAVFFYPKDENEVHCLQDSFGDINVHFSYQVIRIWEVPRSIILDRKLEGLYPLLPLMRKEETETDEQVMTEAVEVIRQVEGVGIQDDLMVAMSLLSEKKYSLNFVNKFIRRELLMQSALLKEWFAEEIKDAEQKTRVVTLRENIVDNLVARFEFVKNSIKKAIDDITDIDILKYLHMKSAKVTSLEEFEQFLNNVLKQ